MKLINWDCIEEMKKMKSESVDLIIADPDYNIWLKLWEWQVHWETNWKKRWHWAKRWWEILQEQELIKFFEEFFRESERILSKWWNIFVYFSTQQIYIIQWIMSKYFKYQNTIIWDKTTVQWEYNKKLKFMYEPILHFSKWETTINIDNIRVPRDIKDTRKYKTEWQNPWNIWRWQSPRGKNKLTNHPTEKPPFITERLIKMSTTPWKVFFIPFLWSGRDADIWIELWLKIIATDTNKGYVDDYIERYKLGKNYFKIWQERLWVK